MGAGAFSQHMYIAHKAGGYSRNGMAITSQPRSLVNQSQKQDIGVLVILI
jgi:hypothetical protein